MRVLSIELGEDELPVEVTVRMTIAEAAAITRIFGRVTPPTPSIAAVHNALTGGFFNRFWEAGHTDPDVPTDLPRLRERISIVDDPHPGGGST